MFAEKALVHIGDREWRLQTFCLGLDGIGCQRLEQLTGDFAQLGFWNDIGRCGANVAWHTAAPGMESPFQIVHR